MRPIVRGEGHKGQLFTGCVLMIKVCWAKSNQRLCVWRCFLWVKALFPPLFRSSSSPRPCPLKEATVQEGFPLITVGGWKEEEVVRRWAVQPVRGLWGVQEKQLLLQRGSRVWPGVSASGTCPGEIIQSHSRKKVGTSEELVDGSYFLWLVIELLTSALSCHLLLLGKGTVVLLFCVFIWYLCLNTVGFGLDLLFPVFWDCSSQCSEQK